MNLTNFPPVLCPRCGSPEVEAMTPATVYACGSRDYDRRPGTFRQSEQCAASKPHARQLAEQHDAQHPLRRT